MTTLQFFTYLHLLIAMPYHCVVAERAVGFWTPGSAGFGVHGPTIYGGTCLQSFWLSFGHANLDWWTA